MSDADLTARLADAERRRDIWHRRSVANANRAMEAEERAAYYHARLVVAEHERETARRWAVRLEQMLRRGW